MKVLRFLKRRCSHFKNRNTVRKKVIRIGLIEAWQIEQERLKARYDREQTESDSWKTVYKSICQNCGTEIYSIGKPRKFCRFAPGNNWHSCSDTYHNKLNLARRQQRRAGKVCPSCGRSFMPASVKAVHCCTACKQQAYRQRKASERDND